MNTQAEELIKKIENVSNRQTPDGRLIKGTRYMTYRERVDKEAELESLKENLSPQNIAASSLSQEGRANMARYAQFLQRDLAENAPPRDLPDDVRNELLRRERELADELRSSLLPTEVMRRNPPGAVGEHMKIERAMKAKQLAYKNYRRVNNPDDDDEDVANVEMLRKSIAPDAASTFMANAQIPGVFAQTPQSKANWPLGEPKIDTPLAQATRREEELMERIARLEEELHSNKVKTGGKAKRMTQEQRDAARQRMVEMHAKRREARAAAQQAQE